MYCSRSEPLSGRRENCIAVNPFAGMTEEINHFEQVEIVTAIRADSLLR